MRMVRTLCVGALVAATPALAEKGPARMVADQDQQICKRTRVTGSLAQTRKVCGTRSFWEERTRRAKGWTRDVLDQGRRQPVPNAG
jgi:hypothetical protein